MSSGGAFGRKGDAVQRVLGETSEEVRRGIFQARTSPAG